MSAQVYFSMDAAQGRFGPCAVTIGNFDGVHRGHQALLAATRDYAAAHQLRPAALTFHPHPAVFVAPERAPEMICSLEERIRLLEDAGAERIMVLPFNEHLALFSPQDFVSQILVKGLHARAVFVGENFRFGNKQAGTTGTLAELGREHDFTTRFIRPVTYRGQVVSSSAVRQYLASGKMLAAARMLGRCFSLTGTVVKGQGIGAKQTVPTLNLRPAAGQVVPRGVFVTQTFDTAGGRLWTSVTNAGTRPTFDGHELTVETFLLEPLIGEPPENIRVEFRRFIRSERQFPDAAALKAQILDDVQRAKAYWHRLTAK